MLLWPRWRWITVRGIPGLDEPAGVGVPEIMGSGPLRQALFLGLGQSGHPDVGVEVLRSHGIDGCSAPAPAGASEH